MQKRVTWILVADGARARVLMNDGVGKGLQPTVDGEMAHALDLAGDGPRCARPWHGCTARTGVADCELCSIRLY